MTSPTRRFVLSGFALAPAALALTAAPRAQASNTCGATYDDGLAQSLNFHEMSPDPARTCHGCAFWTADQSGACGACQMLQRPTPATAVCDSFAARG